MTPRIYSSVEPIYATFRPCLAMRSVEAQSGTRTQRGLRTFWSRRLMMVASICYPSGKRCRHWTLTLFPTWYSISFSHSTAIGFLTQTEEKRNHFQRSSRGTTVGRALRPRNREISKCSYTRQENIVIKSENFILSDFSAFIPSSKVPNGRELIL